MLKSLLVYHTMTSNYFIPQAMDKFTKSSKCMPYARVSVSLCLLLALLSFQLQAQFQPMMIKPGAMGILNSKGKITVPAFCLDERAKTPMTKDVFTQSLATTHLTILTEKQVYKGVSLSDYLGKGIKIEGSGSYLLLDISFTGGKYNKEKVLGVKFEDGSILKSEKYKGYSDSELKDHLNLTEEKVFKIPKNNWERSYSPTIRRTTPLERILRPRDDMDPYIARLYREQNNIWRSGDEVRWTRAKELNTVDGYEAYISESEKLHTGNRHISDARRRKNELEEKQRLIEERQRPERLQKFNEAKSRNTERSYKKFIEESSQLGTSHFVPEAKKLRSQLEYSYYQRAKTASGIRSYLRIYPRGQYSRELSTKLESLITKTHGKLSTAQRKEFINERARLIKKAEYRLTKPFRPENQSFAEAYKKSDLTVIEKKKLGPKRMDINYIALEGGGSSTVIKGTNNEVYVVDTGGKIKDAKNLSSFISKHYGEKQKLRILITHPDADHFGGLDYLIANEDVIEVLFPKAHSAIVSKKMDKISSTSLLGSYHKSMVNDQYLKFSKTADNLAHAKAADLGPVERGRYGVSSDIDFQTFQLTGMRTTNDHSICSKIKYNGVSHLNLGDLGLSPLKKLIDAHDLSVGGHVDLLKETQDEVSTRIREIEMLKKELKSMQSNTAMIQRFMESNSSLDRTVSESLSKQYEHAQKINELETKLQVFVEQKNREIADWFSLKSTILQWPHHHWSPSNLVMENYLVEFLNRVSPQVIVITTPPLAARQNRTRLEDFLKRYARGKNIKIIFLDTAGHYRFISKHYDVVWTYDDQWA
ncbi:MAG: MBL fold metallo-hydrolase [Reichenbachiella sp.]|uniref:MBL fold metallo-hydrolase n=1 Tax=Reichenbachiella sp. TaxID=2184521 RepID=UPI0032643A19